VQLILTTTALTLDEELASRALVLGLDESNAQTRAIHRRQRQARTLEGLLERSECASLVQLHQNAQRLLEPLAVVNPLAPELAFPDGRTRARRDHEKYLTLIDAIALLHQHQRERKTLRGGPTALTYIEATPADVAAADRLSAPVLARSLDDLPPQTRRFLRLLDQWSSAECHRRGVRREAFRFLAREVRAVSGLGPTQVKLHLRRLVELEYVQLHRAAWGHGVRYELVFNDGQGARAETLELARNPGSDPGQSEFLTSGRGSVGSWSGRGRTPSYVTPGW
jgi:DNA primase